MERAATATGDAPVGEADDTTERILDAALGLVARWGVAKTTLADVAKAASCSRATLYRMFPGGKRHLFAALARREAAAYGEAIVEAVDTADDLADAVTRSLVVGARLLRDHDAAQFVLEHEPGLFMPYLGFRQLDRVYDATAAAVGPHITRFVPADRVGWVTEWATRVFVSYLANPDPAVDLVDASATRTLVETFMIPALAVADPVAGPQPVPAL